MDINDGVCVKDCDVLGNFSYLLKFGDLMINFLKVRMLCVKICMVFLLWEGYVILLSVV